MKPYNNFKQELINRLPPDLRTIGEQRNKDDLWILAHSWYEWSNFQHPPLLSTTKINTVTVYYNGQVDILVHQGQLIKYVERPKNFEIDSIVVIADGFVVYIEWSGSTVFDKTSSITLPKTLDEPALLLTSIVDLNSKG